MILRADIQFPADSGIARVPEACVGDGHDLHVWRIELKRFAAWGALTAPFDTPASQPANYPGDAAISDLQAIGRRALCAILARYLDCPAEKLRLSRGHFGKPCLCACADDAAPPLSFNLSHSASRAVVAISSRRVGIDLEAVTADPDLQEIAPWALDEDERAAMERNSDLDTRNRLLLAGWTRKEAALKALGVGLSVEPYQLRVIRSSVSESASLHIGDAEAIPCTLLEFEPWPEHLAAAVLVAANGHD